MFYLIQQNLFKEFNFDRLISTLERFDLKYEIFKQVPFAEVELQFETKETNVFVFGSIKAAFLFKQFNLFPGSFYNENHDYIIYSQYYKENLLNYDSKIQKFSDPIPKDKIMFVRPTEDTKAFDGGLFFGNAWEELQEWTYTNGHNTKLTKDTLVQVASKKEIYAEYRFFVVNKKVITGSQYIIGGRVIYQKCIDEELYKFAQEMVDLYSPSDSFVIDICKTDLGLKIVEINCVNGAGFYDIDIQKLIESLELNYNV